MLLGSVIGISSVWMIAGIKQYLLIDSWNKKYQMFVSRKNEIDNEIAGEFISDNDFRSGILWLRALDPNMIEKNTSSGIMSYRDRVYIVSDIILNLIEYGKMNQTVVTTFCGLNISKHRFILDKMEHGGLIERSEQALGKRSITICQWTPKRS